jgi:hypothetical protein
MLVKWNVDYLAPRSRGHVSTTSLLEWKAESERLECQAHCWVLRDRAKRTLGPITTSNDPALPATRGPLIGTARTLRTA